MKFPFTDLHREINGLMFERPRDVTIKVDNLDRFSIAISETAGLKTAERPVHGAEFCGVTVTANDLVPEGMAVIMHNGEIVNMVRYAA